jgi:DNA-binding MarR family transcriptional regulator
MKVENVNKKPGEVFDLVHRIMHLFRSAQYRVLKDGPYELTHLEGKLLGFFAHHPGATLRDLVAHQKQDKGQLAKLIKSLREQGLLQGEDDEADRRSVRLSLTSEGAAVHRDLRKQVARLSALAVEGLSAAQRGQLAELLEQVRENLEGA